jgi:hypothetical protein
LSTVGIFSPQFADSGYLVKKIEEVLIEKEGGLSICCIPCSYFGASTATGSHTIHQMEQRQLVKAAFAD